MDANNNSPSGVSDIKVMTENANTDSVTGITMEMWFTAGMDERWSNCWSKH